MSSKQIFTFPIWIKIIKIIGDSQEKMNIEALSKKMKISHPSIVNIINYLELEGLVVRTPAQRNRRITLVLLTSRGREVWKTFYKLELQIGSCILDVG